MADKRITELDPFTSIVTGDILLGVDVSDNTDDEAGTSKNFTVKDLFKILSQPYGPPTLLDFAATLTPDVEDGLYRKINMTSDCTLDGPIGGVDSMKWQARFLASGENRNLTIGSGISIPTAFTLVDSTQTIESDKYWIIGLEHNETTWTLRALEGGY